MMTGLFLGIIDTILCLVFNLIYRNSTGYTPSILINVSSIIFMINILLVVLGILYFVFLKIFGKKDVVFILFFLLLTLFCLWKTAGIHRFEDLGVNAGFRGLLTGIILIVGVSVLTLPILFRSRKFGDLFL